MINDEQDIGKEIDESSEFALNISKHQNRMQQTFFSILTHDIIAYHISLVNVQTNYCNNNLFIVDVKQLTKFMKIYYFHTLKALWDGQGKIKMHYGVSRVKKQLSGKRSIVVQISN